MPQTFKDSLLQRPMCLYGRSIFPAVAWFVIVAVAGLTPTQSTFGQEAAEVTIKLGDPVVVARAPADLDRAAHGWGRWQFPKLSRLADGRLLVTFSLEPDSYASSGKPVGCAYSSDDGETWQAGEPQPRSVLEQGTRLPNGDRLKPVELPPAAATNDELPAPECNFVCSYGYPRSLYRADKLPAELRGWRFRRLVAGSSQWIEESAEVDIPDELVHVTAENQRGATPGVGASQAVTDGPLSRPYLWGRLHVAHDQSLWGVTYLWRLHSGNPHYGPVFLRSTDHGHAWRMAGEIRYRADIGKDPHAERRDGLTEPDYSFRPDGSLICLMRTMDGNGHGPLLLTRSGDRGRSWSDPVRFATFGKTPQLLTLDGGVTLATYGASGGPGFFVVRATTDPAGMHWGPPLKVPLRPPSGNAWDTCGHTELAALGPHAALMVYSDFNVPDNSDRLRKTILVRTIHISPGSDAR